MSSESNSGADSSNAPRSSESTLPKCTSDWDNRFVDKLGVRLMEEDIFQIILGKWRLVCLTEDEELEVSNSVMACDLQLNYSSLEDVPVEYIYESSWLLSPKQMEQIRRFPLLKKFLVKLDDFNFILAEIIVGSNSKSAISGGRYETLFDKLLQLFGLYTLNHSFISPEKALIQGRSMTSRADLMVCSQARQKFKRKVVFICKVKKDLRQEDSDSSPPRKKRRTATQEQEQRTSRQEQEQPGGGFIGDQDLLTQHMGELFVYLDSSLSRQGTLGFTIEKAWVRVTYLDVTKSGWSKIKNAPGNRAGCVEYEEGEQPTFFYSKRYNFLNREDRKVLFKALLLIRTMMERRDSH